MTGTFSSISTVSLAETTFIAGTYKEITFDVFDVLSQPVNISSFALSWVLSPFGEPTTVTLTKLGVFRTDYALNNRFTVYLYSTDTVLLGGKYMQQPIISGNTGYDFRLGQGFVNIIPANG